MMQVILMIPMIGEGIEIRSSVIKEVQLTKTWKLVQNCSLVVCKVMSLIKLPGKNLVNMVKFQRSN